MENLTLNELTKDELAVLDGEGWKQAGCALLGTVGLGLSLPVSVVNPGAGLILAGTSLAALDNIK
ncbi:hypothetical protein ACSW9K_16620 (plasmid) [Clostridium perfringens]|uniref:hypothetical protein n=1 Tax=Clostridium perfringens TaxID=1502 RepID=UPI0010DFA7BF|nr:hypothetical protein [Clostridium perfringens]EJT6342412.1 hypothetical protein [Clostridium perfringens]ELC8426011.1 hypothetical protein [Clostridium perfringens]CAJ1611649.1 hypothetical protein CLO5623_03142 [Clostridium perfringens]VTQ54262.1 Uncharacterised protein [Clostridium perfringens]